jgi:hypothetical protein
MKPLPINLDRIFDDTSEGDDAYLVYEELKIIQHMPAPESCLELKNILDTNYKMVAIEDQNAQEFYDICFEHCLNCPNKECLFVNLPNIPFMIGIIKSWKEYYPEEAAKKWFLDRIKDIL